jgi:hypothetical protein
MLNGIIRNTFFVISIGLSSLYALDYNQYYKIDIESMQITLESAQERLECLKKECTLKEQYQIDDRTQSNISSVYENYGITPSKYLRFYKINKFALDDYYENNNTLQNTYNTI